MVAILESMMLICFGISWPISVYKSITSRSTAGKSPIFMTAILVGYVSGILGKIIGGNISYVLVLYLVNFAVVSVDFALYFINRRRERMAQQILSESGKAPAFEKVKKARKAPQLMRASQPVENSVETVENLAKSRA